VLDSVEMFMKAVTLIDISNCNHPDAVLVNRNVLLV